MSTCLHKLLDVRTAQLTSFSPMYARQHYQREQVHILIHTDTKAMGVQPEDRGMDRGCLLRWEAGRDENLTQPDALCFKWKFQQHPRHFGHKYLKVAGCDCFQHRRRWARSQTQTMYQDVSDEVKDQNDHLSQFGTISIPTCSNIPATLLRQNYCPALSEHVTYIVHFNMLTYSTKQL